MPPDGGVYSEEGRVYSCPAGSEELLSRHKNHSALTTGRDKTKLVSTYICTYRKEMSF